MVEEHEGAVAEVEGKVEHITENEPLSLFNVRFQPSDAERYDPYRVADRKHAVWKSTRYMLLRANETDALQWRSQKGQTLPPNIKPVTRKGVPEVIYDPIHKRLQADLLLHLQAKYGHDNVTLEDKNVDITVRNGEDVMLIEVKTDPNPRSAIRQAIGQLLEYAYYWPRTETSPAHLVIIAPGELDQYSKSYIKLLRNKFKMPVSYVAHREGGQLPNLFEQQSSVS